MADGYVDSSTTSRFTFLKSVEPLWKYLPHIDVDACAGHESSVWFPIVGLVAVVVVVVVFYFRMEMRRESTFQDSRHAFIRFSTVRQDSTIH
jgi:hypothetical protein